MPRLNFSGCSSRSLARDAAISITAADPDAVVVWLKRHASSVAVLSVGRSIDLYKDVGAPADIARRYKPDVIAGIESRGFLLAAPLAAPMPAPLTVK